MISLTAYMLIICITYFAQGQAEIINQNPSFGPQKATNKIQITANNQPPSRPIFPDEGFRDWTQINKNNSNFVNIFSSQVEIQPSDPAQKLRQEFQEGRRKSSQITINYTTYLALYKPETLSKFKSGNIMIQTFALYQQNFNRNVAIINNFNRNYSKTYMMGLNKFADLSNEQFRRTYTVPDLYLMHLRVVQKLKKQNKFLSQQSDVQRNLFARINTSEVIDWQQYGNSVKDQGQCRACYAFSALDAIQINLNIRQRGVEQLSVQEIIACGAEQQYVQGCYGGTVAGVYSYMWNSNGVGLSRQYSYDTNSYLYGSFSSCNQQIVTSQYYRDNKVRLKNFRILPGKNCNEIIYTLKYKVVTASIGTQGLQLYANGTYTSPSEKMVSEYDLNHQVTVIGYYQNDTYKIKNSWGKQWGIKGYAYMSSSSGICILPVQPMISQFLI